MVNKKISKLAIGSANFGLDYGLANSHGKISETELKNILVLAEVAGIEVIDTAPFYGDSEARLGTFCSDNRFKMVTKIRYNLENDFAKKSVSRLVGQSRKRLNQTRLYAVMLHQPEILLTDYGNVIIKELLMLKERDIISKIGVSIYSPDILDKILKRLRLDIVQAPFNIFDQQIVSSGWSDKLKAGGVEIHTRSVFLQGLLLLRHSSLKNYFTRNWPDQFSDWYKFLKDKEVDALQIALNFALKQDWIDKVVVGVDSGAQLRSLVEIEESSMSLDFPKLECDDPNLINPSNWNLT